MAEIPDLSATAEEGQSLSGVLADLDNRSRAFGTALAGALSSATVGGKGLESVLRSLATRLSDIALSAALKPLGNATGSLLDSAVSGASSIFAFAKGGVPGALPGSLPGAVTAFADGGVVSAPTYFPMDGNFGLMGEAGSEAILPLKRGSDGALGVAMAGSGGGSNVTINVATPDVQGFRKSEAQIAAMLARSAMRGQRNL